MQNGDPGDFACVSWKWMVRMMFLIVPWHQISASIAGFTLASANFIRDWRAARRAQTQTTSQELQVVVLSDIVPRVQSIGIPMPSCIFHRATGQVTFAPKEVDNPQQRPLLLEMVNLMKKAMPRRCCYLILPPIPSFPVASGNNGTFSWRRVRR